MDGIIMKEYWLVWIVIGVGILLELFHGNFRRGQKGTSDDSQL